MQPRKVPERIQVGAAIPVGIQHGDFGTGNPASFVPGPNNRPAVRSSVASLGPSQAKEHFTPAEGGLDPGVTRQLNALQANVEKALAQVKNSPLANGMLLENVTFIEGDNILAHNLGARPRGFMLTDTDVHTLLKRGTLDDSKRDANEINLISSKACVGSVWIYR